MVKRCILWGVLACCVSWPLQAKPPYTSRFKLVDGRDEAALEYDASTSTDQVEIIVIASFVPSAEAEGSVEPPAVLGELSSRKLAGGTLRLFQEVTVGGKVTQRQGEETLRTAMLAYLQQKLGKERFDGAKGWDALQELAEGAGLSDVAFTRCHGSSENGALTLTLVIFGPPSQTSGGGSAGSVDATDSRVRANGILRIGKRPVAALTDPDDEPPVEDGDRR